MMKFIVNILKLVLAIGLGTYFGQNVSLLPKLFIILLVALIILGEVLNKSSHGIVKYISLKEICKQINISIRKYIELNLFNGFILFVFCLWFFMSIKGADILIVLAILSLSAAITWFINLDKSKVANNILNRIQDNLITSILGKL